MSMAFLQQRASVTEKMRRRSPYVPPERPFSITMKDILTYRGRYSVEERQLDFLRVASAPDGKDESRVFCAGHQEILLRPCVSIVGTRDVSEEGRRRAGRLARELADANVVVVSGLAKGVDTAALSSAIDAGGKAVGVIGTPLSVAYPIENHELQQAIWRDHFLISPFADGQPIFKGNFPKRNRVMAAMSDATVIVEASDTSGTLHQAAECKRLGRWLFIMKSVADDPNLKWPASFLGQPKTAILEGTEDILRAIDDEHPH